MLQSPAYRVLSVSAHGALSRIEVGHAHHGGEDNGKLPVTYEHFEEYGMDRHAIAPALRELVALGFIEVTEPGCAGNAGARQASLYRLTYRGSQGVLSDGSHEWRRITTMTEAKNIAAVAGEALPENVARRGGKRARRGLGMKKDTPRRPFAKLEPQWRKSSLDPRGKSPPGKGHPSEGNHHTPPGEGNDVSDPDACVAPDRLLIGKRQRARGL